MDAGPHHHLAGKSLSPELGTESYFLPSHVRGQREQELPAEWIPTFVKHFRFRPLPGLAVALGTLGDGPASAAYCERSRSGTETSCQRPSPRPEACVPVPRLGALTLFAVRLPTC